MTIFIGILLLLVGVASLGLYPPLRMAGPFILAGVLLLILRTTGAIAADLPVPPKGFRLEQRLTMMQKRDQARFERQLTAPGPNKLHARERLE